MDKTVAYTWSLDDPDTVTDLLSPVKDFVMFNIWHVGDKSHEIDSVGVSTINLSPERLKEEITEYYQMYHTKSWVIAQISMAGLKLFPR